MIEFDWDDGNIKHLAIHRITPEEFEEGITIDPLDLDYDVVKGEDRYTVVGPAKSGRLLLLIYTVRGTRIRAVTAYDAGVEPKKEWMNR